MSHDILLVVEVAEILLGVVVDVVGLFEERGAEEIVEYLPQLGVALEVLHVLFLDGLLDVVEVGLQLRVEVFIPLHFITYIADNPNANR